MEGINFCKTGGFIAFFFKGPAFADDQLANVTAFCGILISEVMEYSSPFCILIMLSSLEVASTCTDGKCCHFLNKFCIGEDIVLIVSKIQSKFQRAGPIKLLRIHVSVDAALCRSCKISTKLEFIHFTAEEVNFC